MSESRAAMTLAQEAARALRVPFVPAPLLELARCGDYLALVWPQLAPSIETAGFLGSALYMADMALDAVETVYHPILSRSSLLDGALEAHDLADLEAVLDVFHWAQPQLLLALSALAEGWDAPRVGGQGRPDPREDSARERAHLATVVDFASPSAGPLPEVAVALGVEAPPDLYRAVAVWPGYLQVAWDELQHLVAYPLFRQRGRALYFYARSSTRFLATPIEVSREALLARGAAAADLERAKGVLDDALPALAMLMMHCCAMRVGLGLTAREVVKST
jgi:Halocarboxylic acid dehydrogenase DehI